MKHSGGHPKTTPQALVQRHVHRLEREVAMQQRLIVAAYLEKHSPQPPKVIADALGLPYSRMQHLLTYPWFLGPGVYRLTRAGRKALQKGQ